MTEAVSTFSAMSSFWEVNERDLLPDQPTIFLFVKKRSSIGILVLTGRFDENCQEVCCEGADVEENAGRLGGTEAEVDPFMGQIGRGTLLIRGAV